jgi:hypothetical protein
MPIEEMKFETDAPVSILIKEEPSRYDGMYGDRWRYYAHVPAAHGDRVFFCDPALHKLLSQHPHNTMLTVCKRKSQTGNKRGLAWEVIPEQQQQQPRQTQPTQQQQQHRQPKDRWHLAAEQAVEILMHACSYGHQEFGIDIEITAADVRGLMAQILIEESKASAVATAERRAA